MRIQLAASIPVIACTLVCVGCQQDGLDPVSGKVLYKGMPAAGATIYFHRNGRAAGTGDVIPTGTVAVDGSFQIATGDAYGAPAGTYNVLIEWLDRPTASKGGAMVSRAGADKGRRKIARTSFPSGLSRVRPPDRLKGRYFDIGHPLMTAEVKPGSNNLGPFELTD